MYWKQLPECKVHVEDVHEKRNYGLIVEAVLESAVENQILIEEAVPELEFKQTAGRSLSELEAELECLLFVAGEPICIAEMARAVVQTEIDVERGLRELQVRLTERCSGLQLIQIAGGWQLSTRAAHSEVVARLMARGSSKLTRAGMETLAIIAYRQPITIPEIESVRGVAAAGVIKTLLERRLIQEAGKKATPGRPSLYATTSDFLHYFGLKTLDHLPEIEEAAPIAAVPADAVTG